jgi:hypothetical protein
MSPTHSNKLGVRYRYYVSHAILQNRKAEAGSIARVPAPEIESLVRNGVRRHLGSMRDGEPATATADRDFIERHVACVIVKPQALEVCLIPTSEASALTKHNGLHVMVAATLYLGTKDLRAFCQTFDRARALTSSGRALTAAVVVTRPPVDDL